MKMLCLMGSLALSLLISIGAQADQTVLQSRHLSYCSGISEVFDKHYGGASMDGLSMWPSMNSTGGVFVRVPDEFMPSVDSFADGRCYCIEYDSVTTYASVVDPDPRFLQTENTVTAPARACVGSEGQHRKAGPVKKPVEHKPVRHHAVSTDDGCDQVMRIFAGCS